MATGLDALFHHLDSLSERPTLADLTDRLTRLDLSDADLNRFIHFGDRHYQRNLVKGGSFYNVWVLCWKVGQRSPIHDHGSSVCGMRVVRGIATVTHFAWAASGDVVATKSEDVPPGVVVGTQDGDLHQVSNLQAGADLVTLHVYMPPLLRMGTYSIFDTARGVDIWTEWTAGAGI